MAALFVAETVGFEPTCPCGQIDFESISLRPLRYVSGYYYTGNYNERQKGSQLTFSKEKQRTWTRIYSRVKKELVEITEKIDYNSISSMERKPSWDHTEVSL